MQLGNSLHHRHCSAKKVISAVCTKFIGILLFSAPLKTIKLDVSLWFFFGNQCLHNLPIQLSFLYSYFTLLIFVPLNYIKFDLKKITIPIHFNLHRIRMRIPYNHAYDYYIYNKNKWLPIKKLYFKRWDIF